MIDYKRIKVAKHDYVVRYTTDVVGHVYRLDLEDVPLLSLEQLAAYVEDNARDAQDESTPQMVLSLRVDGWQMNKNYVSKLNALLSKEREVDECDGGGAAAGGDAGGAVSGDAGASADAGDIAGEMPGTSTADVLGKFEPGKGVMGPGNFMIPARAKHPLHRWEIANGGSKRKRGKNGKPKKYEYEKGMKVVVSMFEGEASTAVDKSKITRKLHRMSKGIKTIDDVKSVEAKVEKDKKSIESRLSKSGYAKAKQIFMDFCGFVKDICSGEYKASWFAVTMVTVGLVYLLSPIDVIPDAIPVAGLIDDAYVLKLIYDAIEDEIAKWRASKK